ncbi:MAG TPA: hypothetical protein VGH99_11255 [Pseudonocardia sp.]|jgi:hypothetical protein
MSASTPPTQPAGTRRALHGVAELLLAGPQYRASGTIRLRVTPSGFGTVADPALRLEGESLVAGATGAGQPLAGRSYAELADGAGVEAGAPEGLYADGSGVDAGERVVLDGDAARLILGAFAVGDRALRAFAPHLEPVLWPEHLDVAVTVGEVNYGVSPGDGYLDEPYAYVGPHRPRTGEFWNAPFGAVRTVAELGDADALLAFFRDGADRATA